MTNFQIARRILLTRTASGVGTLFGAGFGFGLAPATAQTAAFQFPMAPAIRKDEFWANKGNVKLALYRKRFAKPDGEGSLPVFFWCTAPRSRRCRVSISAWREANIR